MCLKKNCYFCTPITYRQDEDGPENSKTVTQNLLTATTSYDKNMTRRFTHFATRARQHLLLMTAGLLGSAAPACADTLDETFDNLTVGSDYKTLSNGWFVEGGESIYASADQFYYGIGSDTDYRAYSGKSLYSMQGTAAKASYVVVPTKLTGTLTFKYRACCSNRMSYTPFVKIFPVSQEGEAYTVGTTPIATLNPTKSGPWADASIDLGPEGTMVAIQLFRSYIDNFAAEVYEEGTTAKAITLTAFSADSPLVTTNMEGGYTATFTLTVKNRGSEDLTADDGVTVSLLGDGRQVLTTSEALVVAAGQTTDVTLTFSGKVNADTTLTFHAKENLSDKEYAGTAEVGVQVFGPRFAIDVADGTPQDYGFVLKDEEATKTYTITNSGNYALSVSVSAPEGFAAESMTVGAGESATLTVGLNSTAAGPKSGNVVLTLNAVDAATFTLPVKGFVADTDRMLVTFSDNQLPDGWEQGTCPWTIADGQARGTYSVTTRTNSEMTTPTLTATEGECLYIMARKQAIFPEFSVWYSTDDGDSWSREKYDDLVDNDDEQLLTLGPLAAGSYKLRFEGYNIALYAINGLSNDGQGDVTAIAAAATDAAAAAGHQCYNLQGLRVDQPRKGRLYIVNGKKIVK